MGLGISCAKGKFNSAFNDIGDNIVASVVLPRIGIGVVTTEMNNLPSCGFFSCDTDFVTFLIGIIGFSFVLKFLLC